MPEGLEEDALTPVEQIESGVSRIREEVASELLSKLQGKEPGFFEQAVILNSIIVANNKLKTFFISFISFLKIKKQPQLNINRLNK